MEPRVQLFIITKSPSVNKKYNSKCQYCSQRHLVCSRDFVKNIIIHTPVRTDAHNPIKCSKKWEHF